MIYTYFTFFCILILQPFAVDVGYERFLGPEIFFHPEVRIVLMATGSCLFKLSGNAEQPKMSSLFLTECFMF